MAFLRSRFELNCILEVTDLRLRDILDIYSFWSFTFDVLDTFWNALLYSFENWYIELPFNDVTNLLETMNFLLPVPAFNFLLRFVLSTVVDIGVFYCYCWGIGFILPSYGCIWICSISGFPPSLAIGIYVLVEN